MSEGNVVVATVQGQFAEAQVRSFLESHGIQTAVSGEALRTTHGIAIDGLGAVHILVAAEQAEEARALLAAADRGELRVEDA